MANTTVTGTELYRASTTATLGSALVVDGTDIQVHAAQGVSFLDDVQISGVFSADNTPGCPP